MNLVICFQPIIGVLKLSLNITIFFLLQKQNEWTSMCIKNIACVGKFSSDRTIREYTQDIWHASTVDIPATPRVPLNKKAPSGK